MSESFVEQTHVDLAVIQRQHHRLNGVKGIEKELREFVTVPFHNELCGSLLTDNEIR